MSEYEPELGQAMYSQWSENEVPSHVEAMLMSIRSELTRVFWNINQEDIDPFSNSGAKFEDLDKFKVRAYSWELAGADEPLPPNFEWGDFKLWWYKYFGRGMSCNRAMKPDESAKMLTECLEAIRKYELKNDRHFANEKEEEE